MLINTRYYNNFHHYNNIFHQLNVKSVVVLLFCVTMPSSYIHNSIFSNSWELSVKSTWCDNSSVIIYYCVLLLQSVYSEFLLTTTESENDQEMLLTSLSFSLHLGLGWVSAQYIAVQFIFSHLLVWYVGRWILIGIFVWSISLSVLRMR